MRLSVTLSGMNDPALGALYDSRRSGTPVVTYAFLALCVVVTISGLLVPRIEALFGGVGEINHVWQPFTSVLMHGWPGFPALVHLGLNAILILECGRPCERLVGSGRFLLLSVASMIANAGLQFATGGVNGSSLVIWSWGPPLFVALVRRDEAGPAADRLRGILVVMYGVLTALMGLMPYLAGWRGNPVIAFLRANQFHILATIIGAIAAVVWRRRIARRLHGFESGSG